MRVLQRRGEFDRVSATLFFSMFLLPQIRQVIFFTKAFAPSLFSPLLGSDEPRGLPHLQPRKWLRPSVSPVEFPEGNPIQQGKSLQTNRYGPAPKPRRLRRNTQDQPFIGSPNRDGRA